MSAAKKAKRLCSFRKEYSTEWPCIVPVSTNEQMARCTICNADFGISHGGKQDCERHIKSSKHVNRARDVRSSASVSSFFSSPNSGIDNAVTRAEVLFTGFLIEHNIPLAASDHVGKLLRSMLIQPGVSPTEILKKYACARTKTTAIVKEMAAAERNSLILCMQNNTFSIATDASNDKNEKLYPIVVRLLKDGDVKTELLSILECDGKSTGENIKEMLMKDLASKGINIGNCMALTTDNANVMIGKKNGLYGKLLELNPSLFLTGCVCHRLHLAAEWANKELPLNVNDFFVDIYYYIEKSANRLKCFQHFQEECGTPVREVPKHCPTRWLSLGFTCQWVLDNWDPLLKFFTTECHGDKEEAARIGGKEGATGRKEKVLLNLQSRTMKLCVLYLAYVIPVFDVANQLFQQEAPLIHKQRQLMMRLIKDLLTMFVKPCGLRGKLANAVDFISAHNILDSADLMVGSAVRKFMDKEKLTTDKRKEFFKSVVKFLRTACSYLIKNLPLEEQVLKHAEVANISSRDNAKFSSLTFFLSRFPALLSDLEEDTLEKEFREYLSCDLPSNPEFENNTINQQWIMMKQLTDSCGSLIFKHLPTVMLQILSIPHSNASCERMFSLVRANRTDFRSSMSVETLQAIITLKQIGQPCFERKPSPALLKACKSATTVALTKPTC